MKNHLLPLLLLPVLLLAGCREGPASSAGSGDPGASSLPEEPLIVENLAVELPRDLDTASARAAMEGLPALLAPHGVTVGQVSVTFGTSYAATAAALDQGGVQLAFLPAADFVQFCHTALPVLADAEQEEAAGTSALICAGPSEYGARLAELSQRRSLTWTELDHARWGVLDRDSLAGYQCLELWLEDNCQGNGVGDLTSVTAYDSWEDLLRGAAREEIDLFPLGWDQTAFYAPLWTVEENRTGDGGLRGFGRQRPMETEVRSIAETQRLYRFVAAVTPGDQVLASERFQTALSDALARAFDGPAESRAAIGADRCLPVQPEDLDGLRRLLFGT